MYRCREYCKYISTTGLILHCLAASMVITWLEQQGHARFTCCAWPYSMQDWTIRSLPRYISTYLYLRLGRTLLFPSMSVFAAPTRGGDAFLVTPLWWACARKGRRAKASCNTWTPQLGLPRVVEDRRNTALQLRPLKCSLCLCLLMVMLVEKKKFWVNTLPQTERSGFLFCEAAWWWSEGSEHSNLLLSRNRPPLHLPRIWLFCEWSFTGPFCAWYFGG